MSKLAVPKAPNLPLSPSIPDGRYIEQLTNAQRLYYNQLDTVNASVLGTRGGKWLEFPYAAVQRTTDKTFTINTATQITFDQTDYISGCTNSGLDGIAVEQAGIYNYQFSTQFKNTDTQIHSAWIWLRINGVDVPGTGSKFDIISSHGGTPGFVIGSANFYVQLQVNDTVEMWAAVDNVAVTFDATAAQTSPFAMPAIPSVVATLSFVSNLST